MFKRLNVTLVGTPSCTNSVNTLTAEDFQYYDKDGFELNQAEQQFYYAMGHPVNASILNHSCYQEPWYAVDDTQLILDHAMIMHRCSYNGDALEQLKELAITMPQATYLINTKPKWGFDFALDAIDPRGNVYEVLHVEYDNRDFQMFRDRMLAFETTAKRIDWKNAADSIYATRNEWEHLTGFNQNHWKARYLLGWQLAEYTEKTTK
jgi:hypothetical protein